jgi:hypothetical protein
MRIGGCSRTWGLSNNSDTLDTGKEKKANSGTGTKIGRVAIQETENARLSSLRQNPSFSLLATHLIEVRHIHVDTEVRYCRVGRFKVIVTDCAQYQERGGKISAY